MHISVVSVLPPPVVGPTVRIIPGVLQGDADIVADVHNGHINIGEPMSGDADLNAQNGLNLDFSLPVALEGDADMSADFTSAAYITGDRHTSITARDNIYPDQRGTNQTYDPNSAYVDGSSLLSGTFSVHWPAGFTTGIVVFDFRPSGFSQVINEIRWKQDVIGTHGFWKVEAWDGLNWDTLNTGFVLGTPATQLIPLTNSKPYLIYRLVQLSGSTNSTPWINEVEFRQMQGPAVSTFTAGTAYANTGGQGNRNASITVTTNKTMVVGNQPVTRLLDGVTGGFSFVQWTSGQTGHELVFDFTTLGKQIIDEVTINYATGNGLGRMKWQGSNDNVTWSDIGTWNRLDGVGGGGDKVETIGAQGNQRGFLMYRYKQIDVDVTSNGAPIEFKFKIAAALAADMSGDADLIGDVDATTDTGMGGVCGTTSYNNADGKGDRTASIVVTPSGGLLSAGTGVEFVDGLFTLHAIGFNAGVTNGKIKFDFGNPRIIDKFTFWNSSAASQGNWQWYGSNDNSTFTAIGAAFDLHGSTGFGGAGGAIEYNEPNGNSTEYRYYELQQISGTTTAIFPTEFQFHIACDREIHPAASALQGDSDMTADVNVSGSGTSLISTTEFLQISTTETLQSEL